MGERLQEAAVLALHGQGRVQEAGEHVIAVQRGHVFADFMAHAPRGLVGHSNVALDALGRNAVPRRREQEHDVEPIAQAGASAIERRSGGRIQLVGAPVALVGAARFYAAILRRTAALRAIEVSAVAHLKQVIEAAILGREASLKLAKGGSMCCHAHSIAERLTCFKGIYPNDKASPQLMVNAG